MQTAANVIELPARVLKTRARRVRTRISYMDNAQLEKLLRAAKEHGPREHAMFLFAVAHGARASEICNLKISDVNFKTEQVHVARLKGSLDSIQALLRVKGSTLLNEVAALKAWLEARKPDANEYVFNSQKSVRLNRVSVFKLFRQIARAAELPESLQHPHVLKHTAAMLMVKSGVNAFLIRQHLGHRSFDSTLQYVNATDVDASAAFAKACSVAF
jgi:type 1 fimbriae regulatory protein FimB